MHNTFQPIPSGCGTPSFAATCRVGLTFSRRGPFTVPQNLTRSILHALSYYVSQVLMMVFMAYNGYFCASLVLGRFAGYFFFAVFLPTASHVPAGGLIPGDHPKTCCS